MPNVEQSREFYDNLILSGTKIPIGAAIDTMKFYDNLILSGTKIKPAVKDIEYSFTIT